MDHHYYGSLDHHYYIQNIVEVVKFDVRVYSHTFWITYFWFVLRILNDITWFWIGVCNNFVFKYRLEQHWILRKTVCMCVEIWTPFRITTISVFRTHNSCNVLSLSSFSLRRQNTFNVYIVEDDTLEKLNFRSTYVRNELIYRMCLIFNSVSPIYDYTMLQTILINTNDMLNIFNSV